jgi:hypothetical protein
MSVGLGYDPNRALNGSVSAAFVMPTSMLDRLGTKLWKSNTQTVRWRFKIIVLVEPVRAVMVVSYSDMERD